MKRKRSFNFVIMIILILFLIIYYSIGAWFSITHKTKGLMLLIEFEGMDSLNNFVSILEKRNIPALLVVSSDFVQKNCESIKALQEKNIEIGGTFSDYPLWDKSYDEQFNIINETKAEIENCTGKEMRVFGSKYFAYDENTVKAAEKLGVKFILARGTTGAKATIYQPEEYNVKIFSVSNVNSKKWGTGSLCDYSYWAREGSPEDFEKELFGALLYNKISPVSHTYLSGIKKRWNEVYVQFFDIAKVKWQNLNEFGQVDEKMPFSEIPQNREVQYTTPKPAIPLEQEPNITNNNVCGV